MAVVDNEQGYEPRLIPWYFLGKRIGYKLVKYPVKK